MREDFPLDACAGCGAARTIVAVERIRLGALWHRAVIHHPHASCGPGGCDYELLAEERLFTVSVSGRRTSPSRRRA